MFAPAILSLAASFGVVTGADSVPAPGPAAPSALVAPATDPPARRHSLTAATAAGMSPGELMRAEQAVSSAVERREFPGAALAVGRHGAVVLEQGYGTTGTGAWDSAVDPDRTVYDLASLSKVVGTTTAVMLLVEDGHMRLDDPVVAYLPEFSGGGKENVTIRHLLTHSSGLPAGGSVWGSTPEEALTRAVHIPLVRGVGERVEYSDIGFVVLFAAAERAAGEPLYRLLDRRVFAPLGMTSTTFLAGEGCERCAPTSRPHGDAYRGKAHDPIARRLGGLAGNAGLFSTVHDMARFAAMLAGEGELDGVRVLQASTVRSFVRRQPGAATRALGWDTPAGGNRGAAGARISPNAFGHTGFTGTSLWVDPDRGTWTVLLTNRTYDEGPNRMQALRRSVHDHVSEAADRGLSRYAAGN